MDQVPFFALHGIKISVALIVIAAVIGVARYLRRPARAARRRRRGIDLPAPTPISELSIGDRVTLEGTLVADGALDLGGGESAAVAAVALDPGRSEESRRTAAAGALAIEVEGRRVAIDEACDVRAGSRELYPRLAIAYQRNEAVERLRGHFGMDLEPVRAPALLMVRAGDRVRAFGRVEAVAGAGESGYRDGQSDWRLAGAGDDDVALWHPGRPTTRGNSAGGAAWRAAWVGGAAFAILMVAAQLSFKLAFEAEKPATVKKLADVASLSPWMRYRAAWHYTDVLEAREPTRERGRAIAALYELHGRCGRAARELFARQDLEEAIAVAERCPSTEGREITVAALLLQGELGEAARRAEAIHERPEASVRLFLRAGEWREARRVLDWSIVTPDDEAKPCLDAWLAAQLGEPYEGELAWGSSYSCTSLRADQLDGRARLELLGEEARFVSGLHGVLAFEAHLEARATAPAELRGPVDPDKRENAIYQVERRTRSVLTDVGRLLSDQPRDIRPELALLASLGELEASSDEVASWSLVPAQLARASLAALRGDHDQARADAARAESAAASMRAWLRDAPDVRRTRDVELPPVEGILSFLAGATPSPEQLPSGSSRGFIDLAAQRRACAGGHIIASGVDPLEVYGRACRGDLRALVDGQRDRYNRWDGARRILVSIAPVLGEAPGLAETLAAAPLLPDLSPPVDVPGAYGLATQMRLIYEALGHADLAGLWKQRALNLQDVLLAREPAVPLDVLSSVMLTR